MTPERAERARRVLLDTDGTLDDDDDDLYYPKGRQPMYTRKPRYTRAVKQLGMS